MIDAPCLDKVDWAHWRSFAHTLPQSHTTLAREVSASSEQDKTDKGALAMVRRDCAPFLTTLIAEIRQRNYSIRTEKVYELWACRFILFNNANNPEQLGTTEVVSFLQHLAMNRNVAASTQNHFLREVKYQLMIEHRNTGISQ